MLQLKVCYKPVQNRLSNGYRMLKSQDRMMTDDPIFSKNALILSKHIALSKFTGCKNFVKLKET